MMVQNFQDINPAWAPDFKSFASEICFFAFASGQNTFWSDGVMTYNNVAAIPDSVHYHEVRRIYGGNNAPEWADEAVNAIDQSLPDVETILRSMDDYSLVLSSTPAVFRLPQTPYRVELAKCIFAARILHKCRDFLVLPVEYDEAECLEDLRNASYLCSVLGGEWAIQLASSWAADSRSFAI